MFLNRRRGQFWPNSNIAQFPPRPWHCAPNLPQWLFPGPSLNGPLDLPLNPSRVVHPLLNFSIGAPVQRGAHGHRRPYVGSPRKRIHSGGQLHDRPPKRKRLNSVSPKASLNPTDPLNLQDLMKETERRRVEGLSPLRGDSRLNTPAVNAGDIGSSSPVAANVHLMLDLPRIRASFMTQRRGSSRCQRRNLPNRFKRRPITGNYPDYYSRRDPHERLHYLMPEWFSGKDVADYGCHNGTMTFMILERFPDTKRIDAFDCDADLIANAKCMQRERMRWETSFSVSYQKIRFQAANWVESDCPCIDEPEYDTILAFSVTKWIHLNHGDAGLMRFFRRAFNLLKPGGHLILEPQPISSYRRTRFTVSCIIPLFGLRYFSN
ncbi:unnamed protein product [Protopolystoma xenopodis]|uniref:RNA methyltransferase n=1 Tax=Protopolystoma xenopodis TaxID=117903 RepID=A0A3S5AR75_9PLAT|nr:unnamed protein product [Protopolystoma xenopodis]